MEPAVVSTALRRYWRSRLTFPPLFATQIMSLLSPRTHRKYFPYNPCHKSRTIRLSKVVSLRPAPLALSPSKHTVPKHSTIIRSILGSQKTMKPTPNPHLNDKRTNIYQNVSWKGRNRREWDSHSVSYFSLLYDVQYFYVSTNQMVFHKSFFRLVGL